MSALPLPLAGRHATHDVTADRGFRWLVTAAGVFVLVALGAAALSMVWGGHAALQKFGLGFLWDRTWDPVGQQFG
ncbi:MAG: pstC, partial [Xanthomonadaceae bacterium]|nr:pstC [Xanthomonadaceae bacterium]